MERRSAAELSAGAPSAIDTTAAAAAELRDLAAPASLDVSFGADLAGIERMALALADSPVSTAVKLAAAHVGLHALASIGRGFAARGVGAPSRTGAVNQVSASRGGVPKVPLLSATIGFGGLDGDVQAARKHHGRPWQAVSLWSAEVIEALAAEGHPITPGAAGENITVSGIDWATIRPNVRMAVGTALLETTAYAIPCKKNAQWFVGGDFNRMHHDRHPGWSRMYALVLEPGTVMPGDPVVIEP